MTASPFFTVCFTLPFEEALARRFALRFTLPLPISASGVGVGSGVLVGASVGLGEGVGVGDGLGVGVFVRMIGSGVAVGSGTFVGVAVGRCVGASVGSGVSPASITGAKTTEVGAGVGVGSAGESVFTAEGSCLLSSGLLRNRMAIRPRSTRSSSAMRSTAILPILEEKKPPLCPDCSSSSSYPPWYSSA